jgi:PKHD-type hydroxylase
MHAIDQVLTAAELEAIRALVARSRFADGAASAHGAAKNVKANQQLECSLEDHKRLVETVFGALHRSREFSRTALPVELSVPMVNRYGVGMTYGAHYDQPFMPTPDGPRIRGDLSATLFVSDPADYDGGELCFTRIGAEERIKLKAGDLFLYPASTLHRVAPVTRGERLAVVFWIQSMIRDHEKRSMVVELDGLVGRVAERMPGSTEVRDLAGLVGNLTRMWAELVVALAVIAGAALAPFETAPSGLAAAVQPTLQPFRGLEQIPDDRVGA